METKKQRIYGLFSENEIKEISDKKQMSIEEVENIINIHLIEKEIESIENSMPTWTKKARNKEPKRYKQIISNYVALKKELQKEMN